MQPSALASVAIHEIIQVIIVVSHLNVIDFGSAPANARKTAWLPPSCFPPIATVARALPASLFRGLILLLAVIVSGTITVPSLAGYNSEGTLPLIPIATAG